MKSLIISLLFSSALLFLMSCSDSNAPTSTGPGGVSTKLDTLESPEMVWIDTAAIYLDTVNYFFYDTIIFEVHVFDSITGLPIATADSSEIIVSSDTILKINEPSGMIRVNWTPLGYPIDKADIYYILVSDTSNSGNFYYWKAIAESLTVDGNGNYSYIVEGLSPETSYDAYVFGYNTARNERGGQTKSNRTIDLKGSPSPEMISVNVNSNTATVSWSPVEGARRYNVIYTDIISGISDTARSVGSETNIMVPVAPNTTYKVRIVPEGFAVVDSILKPVIVDLGPSFGRIDTIYPYDPSLSSDSAMLILPYVLFSTHNESWSNNNFQSVKGGYFLRGDIWSTNNIDSLEEVVLKTFNLGKYEITNKQYLEFLNDLDVKLEDSKSNLQTLDTVVKSSVLLWDSTSTTVVLYDSTYNAGDTITTIDTVVMSMIINTVIYDTLTKIDSLYYLDSITFNIDGYGDYTIIKDTFFLSATVSETLSVSDTIIYKTIVPALISSDTLAVYDSTYSIIAQPVDTLDSTFYLYSEIGVQGAPYKLVVDNSILSITSDSEDTVTAATSLLMNPVRGVTWEGAALYCNWLSEKYSYSKVYDENNSFTIDTTKNGFRLPTEAEFEYVQSAAFLGTKYKYSWGSDPLKIDTSYNKLLSITEIDQYYGIYGLTGNVLEWCSDLWTYGLEPSTSNDLIYNPINLSGTNHALKGGSFADSDKVTSHKSYYRLPEEPTNYSSVGFRLARWPQ